MSLREFFADYRQADLPKPTAPTEITVPEGATLALVSVDMAEYRRKHNVKSVKKTLSIPEWLNEEALACGINFSQVLQEALLQKLLEISAEQKNEGKVKNARKSLEEIKVKYGL